jgi:uncharacterized membrane protein
MEASGQAEGSTGLDGTEVTALAHLYRGEMHRMTVWRERLDVTSNWAIVLTMALTTFALGTPDVPHYVLLLGLSLIGMSILIEGRRYRHLYHSKWRLHLMEVGLFSELLQVPDRPHLPGWRSTLAQDLRHPDYSLSWSMAVRIRLRRNYLMLFYFITGVWIVKIFIHPDRALSLAEFYTRLQIGDFIPSWFVAITASVFVATATLAAASCPSAETLEDWAHVTDP